MATAPGTATTVRSARDGDDRLFVRGSDGRRIGWYDLRTGVTSLVDTDPGAAAEVQAAVDAWVTAASPLRRRRPIGAAPAGLATSAVPAPRAPQRRLEDPAAGPAPDAGRVPESLHDRRPGEHVTRLLVDRAGTPAGPRRLSGRDPFGPSLRHAHEAVLGQQRVGAVLARLGGGWHVLHAVPTGEREWLDHLLVGPAGVVVLRTAAHRGGTLRVAGSLARAAGRPVSHVRLLAGQTQVVADRLRDTGPAGSAVPVRGVVVVVGTRDVRAEGLPAGTSVVRLEDLARWVRELPTVLSRMDVARLAASASRPQTWPAEAGLHAGAAARGHRREQDHATFVRLTARARGAARMRRARRTALIGATAAAVAPGLLLLRPGLLPQAVAAVSLVTG